MSTGAVVAIVSGTVLAGGLVVLYISQRKRVITEVGPKFIEDVVNEYGGEVVDKLGGYVLKAVREYGVALFSSSGKNDYNPPPPAKGIYVN